MNLSFNGIRWPRARRERDSVMRRSPRRGSETFAVTVRAGLALRPRYLCQTVVATHREMGMPALTALSSTASNSTLVGNALFRSPTQDSVVTFIESDGAGGLEERQIKVSALFKKTVLLLLTIVGVCLLIEIALVFAWPQPTPLQQYVVSVLDWGWKIGLGLIIGLVIGKQTDSRAM